MADITVSDDVINSPAASAYFSRADRRVMIGLRAALEMLSIPIPAYAERKPIGRPPAKAVREAYRKDHPGELVRKPVYADPLGPHRIACAVAKANARDAKRAEAQMPSLHDQIFNG
jgi:hypothetical protein